jgi:type IV pilus assembly protein PilC
MSGSYLQTLLFTMNRPEPLRQASLLMVLASSIGDGELLTEALRSHARDSGSPWTDRLQSLRLLLEQGQTLSSALSANPGLLPDSTMIAIRVAEENGTLRDVLADEATRLMRTTHGGSGVSQNLVGTLLWLSMISTVATSIVWFIMFFIIPKFKKIFDDFDTELPQLTIGLINTSDVMMYAWPLFLLPAVTIAIGMFVLSLWAGMLRLGRGILPWCQHWPRFWMPDVLRMLSFTVTAGKPISGALSSITREMQPGRAATQISQLRSMVDSGHDCIEAMETLRLLSHREAAFLKAAEHTNHLDWAMQHLSRSIGRRRARWVHRLANLLQPAIVLVVGILVGFIVVALFLPLIKLLNDLS